MIRRLGYAALFVIALPISLAAWAHRLDSLIALPAPPDSLFSPATGIAVFACGVALMCVATADLWRFGHGLPASPFPPERLVTRGAYRFLANPLYVGAVGATLGAALWMRSTAGVWIVAPTLALAVTAFVAGFERDATRRRFGVVDTPSLRLPPPTDERPTIPDRVSLYVLVFGPWLVLYQAVEFLGAPLDARSTFFSWDAALPIIPWTEAIYAGTYGFVLAAPLVAGRRRDLAELARAGLAATALIIPLYLLLPLIAVAKPVVGDGWWQTMLRWERIGDAPVTAFPSFHVVWAFLAARTFISRFPRLRSVFWSMATVMSVSGVTVGLHAAVDLVAGFAILLVVLRRRALWELVRREAELVGNSWHEWTLGPVRVINHGIYAGLGAVASIALSLSLIGPSELGWLAACVGGAVIGAALWGQAFEGSSVLLRPYGYFGAVAGVVVVTLFASAVHADAWLVFCGFGVGSTITSAFGRLRCLVQGCCHGCAASQDVGIRFVHPRSRVVRLSTLGGVPVHPTQLYAIVTSLFIGCVLVRLWFLAAPLSFIAGMYFVLMGLCRFVEEHFRGEPQTVSVAGLRAYQWIAIAFVIGGAALTTIRTSPAPAPHALGMAVVPALIIIGLLTTAAYGVDLPESDWRFSRLT